MSATSVVVYNLLVEGGVSDEAARQLAEILVTRDDLAHLATKADLAALRTDFAEFKAEMHQALGAQTRLIITTLVAMTAIFAAIVKLI
jgi:hypothetical protein